MGTRRPRSRTLAECSTEANSMAIKRQRCSTQRILLPIARTPRLGKKNNIVPLRPLFCWLMLLVVPITAHYGWPGRWTPRRGTDSMLQMIRCVLSSPRAAARCRRLQGVTSQHAARRIVAPQELRAFSGVADDGEEIVDARTEVDAPPSPPPEAPKRKISQRDTYLEELP
eukprot:scaffold9834_cov131-Skeletonema_dohrnii-CCMP3373.AAC.1